MQHPGLPLLHYLHAPRCRVHGSDVTTLLAGERNPVANAAGRGDVGMGGGGYFDVHIPFENSSNFSLI